MQENQRKYIIHSLLAYSAVFFGYMAIYLIRKNFNIAAPYLKDIYHFSNGQIGLIAAAFTIPYGIGKFVIGFIADQTNAKKVVGILLLFGGIFNICLAYFLGGIWMMMLFWALNGFFQSAGGPASYATISRWFPQKVRGTALGFWNISHNIGGALAAAVALLGLSLFSGNVQGMFIFPGIIAIVISMYTIFVGYSKPEAAGLPSVEDHYKEAGEKGKNSQFENMPLTEILKKYVFNNKFVWLLCVSNIFVYVVRIGLDQWITIYLPSLGFTNKQAAWGFTCFEMAAIPGTFIWGFLSDLFKGRRAMVCIICFIPLAFIILIYSHITNLIGIYICLGLMGGLIFGPQLLIGVAIVDFVPKKAIATANGLTGTFGYLGGDLLAKVALGYMSDYFGWISVFTSMWIAIACGICFMAVIAKEENRRINVNAKILKRKEHEENKEFVLSSDLVESN